MYWTIKDIKGGFYFKVWENHVPINMFVRCVLVLILTVALGQTLKCYNCSKKPNEKPTELISGVCKNGELGELEHCDGQCFKTLWGRWYFLRHVLQSQRFYKPNHDRNHQIYFYR